MMFRHQKIMKVYFQLGSKFNLPNDLVYFLYNFSKKEEKRMIHETKIFYKNMILYLTLEYNIVTLNDILNTNKDLFNHCLPIDRGIEWGIRCRRDKLRVYLTTPDYSKRLDNYQDYRKWLLVQINIIGEENYLMQQGGKELIEASLKSKIKYLNTSPYNEIIYDYYNYKEREGSGNEDSWRLLIDNYGEGNYMNTLN